MEIIIKFKCQNSWDPKMNGVVLVEKQEDIEPVWKVLCEQDDYWENYKELIKVAPKEIDSYEDIRRMCEYCGKTDIYDVPKVKSKLAGMNIDIILYQYSDNCDY